MYRQSEKNLLSSNYRELQPTSGGDRFVSLGTPGNFNGFRVLAALPVARHSSSERQPNCGVEQRAPPIFGRATITLGTGPHSSFCLAFYRAPPFVPFCSFCTSLRCMTSMFSMALTVIPVQLTFRCIQMLLRPMTDHGTCWISSAY